jgi:transposase
MPAPYSNDLREKAIAAVRRGEKKIEICRMLKISRNTLDLWVKRVEKTGNCRPKVAKQKGSSPKIKELQKFRDFALKHQEKT